MSNTNYTMNITNLLDKIQLIESELRSQFKVKFIAYDQFELKITFDEELSDEMEQKLIDIVYKVE
jgi:hypothetical protein